MSDRIEILGIRGHGFHGVLESESRMGQEFLIDVTLDLSTADAAASDDLTKTVDYSAIAQFVHELIVGKPFKLIEALAHHTADAIMRFERVDGVTVRVHKPKAPIPVPFDDVIVTVHRTR